MAANLLPILALGAAALFLMKKKGSGGGGGAEVPPPGWIPRHGTYTDEDGNPQLWQTIFWPKTPGASPGNYGWGFDTSTPLGWMGLATEQKAVDELIDSRNLFRDAREDLVGPPPWAADFGQWQVDGGAGTGASTGTSTGPTVTGPSGYKDVPAAEMLIIQQQLLALGFSPGTLDGQWRYGGNTYKAVKSFQGAHGLQADGKPGSNTRSKLNELTASGGGAGVDNVYILTPADFDSGFLGHGNGPQVIFMSTSLSLSQLEGLVRSAAPNYPQVMFGVGGKPQMEVIAASHNTPIMDTPMVAMMVLKTPVSEAIAENSMLPTMLNAQAILDEALSTVSTLL